MADKGDKSGTNIRKAYETILNSISFEKAHDNKAFEETQHIIIMFTDGINAIFVRTFYDDSVFWVCIFIIPLVGLFSYTTVHHISLCLQVLPIWEETLDKLLKRLSKQYAMEMQNGIHFLVNKAPPTHT